MKPRNFENEDTFWRWALLHLTPIAARTQPEHEWYHTNKERFEGIREQQGWDTARKKSVEEGRG